jgi:DNA-directed RNA polymerase III subunit RPC3
VELRNRSLADVVADNIGETTSQIYAVLLGLLTAKLSRCQPHPGIDADLDDSDVQPYVTTNEVFDHLSPSLDVGSGIGKVDAAQVDPQGVERIRRRRPRPKEPYVRDDENDSADDEDGDQNGYGIEYDEELERHALKQQSEPPAQNGAKESKVKFRESKTSESRLSLMRQHLLILCESTHGFLRHRGNGQWTVDFQSLVRRIQERELDTVIERKIGRHSLRLIRILRKRGKADEKSLPMQAMMAKATVHKTMLEMQMHGFVDVQEIPKDSTRNAKSTIFLWFCDTDLSLTQLLDNTYKTMLRCLQVREVHRQDAREVLRFVGRPDVKGREKEALEKKYFDRYDRYRSIEDKILGHVMRLDDMVGILRDY